MSKGARWTAAPIESSLLLSTHPFAQPPFVAIAIMSDQCEEQEMEAEALSAIFDTAFQVTSDTQPFEWTVKLVPVDCGGDPDEEESQNHVGINLLVTVPLDYPETSLPELDVQILKGLTEEHRTELLRMATAEAANNEGMPAIFAICEVLREWLSDHNTRGLDDASMHAQMMRRALEEERKKVSQARTNRAEMSASLPWILYYIKPRDAPSIWLVHCYVDAQEKNSGAVKIPSWASSFLVAPPRCATKERN